MAASTISFTVIVPDGSRFESGRVPAGSMDMAPETERLVQLFRDYTAEAASLRTRIAGNGRRSGAKKRTKERTVRQAYRLLDLEQRLIPRICVRLQ